MVDLGTGKEREKRELLLKLEAEADLEMSSAAARAAAAPVVAEVALAPIETEAKADVRADRSAPPPAPREPGAGPRLWFGLGAGRCGMHSLACLLNLAKRSAALCLSSMPDHRLLLWEPGEARADVVRRRLAALRRGASVDVVGEINYAWLPYVPEILAQYQLPRRKVFSSRGISAS